MTQATRVAILWDPTAPAATGEFQGVSAAARTLGLHLQSLEVRRPDDFASAFQAAGKERAEALVVAALGGLFHLHRAQIVDLALKSRLPAIYTLRDYVRAGGLMSYSTDHVDQTRRAAIYYVDRILKGSKPADLPVPAADEVRLGDQHQDHQGARPDDFAVGAGAGGPRDRVSRASPRACSP